MENVRKELVIAGIVGGVTSLAVAFVARRFLWKRGCHGGRRWGEQKIVTMESENMPAAVGPYSKGKIV